MIAIRSTLIFGIYFILCTALSFAQTRISGKVIRIADGDTFTLLDNHNKQSRIRLHGIDCPEKNQDYYQVAKDFLSDAIFKKIVDVEITDNDRYGRLIGRVWISKVDVNLSLIKNGLAWHYKHFDKSKSYADAELSARNKKLNIWSLKNPVAPWDFRRTKK